MKKLLIDTNIIFDLLSKRDLYYDAAAQLFSLSDQKQIELKVCSLSFANTHYILKRQLSEAKVREILRKLKVLVEVVPLNSTVLDKALNSEFKDFEDGLQYYSAMESNVDIIITRNLKDFKKSNIPIMTASQFITLITNDG